MIEPVIVRDSFNVYKARSEGDIQTTNARINYLKPEGRLDLRAVKYLRVHSEY